MQETQLGKSIFIGLAIIVLFGIAWYWFSQKPEGDQARQSDAATQQPQTETAKNEQAQAPAESAENHATETNTHKNMNIITIETNYGKIMFETYDTDAPKTVANFITLAKKGFYDNLIFHRVIKGFMIQGGDPKGDGTGGPGYAFEDEIRPDSPIYREGYKKGIVAMANSGPNTNGSQFFIMLENYPLPPNYTIFGKVISGQEVVDEIGSIKTGLNDRPMESVIMKKITVEAK